jgi:hypothetical protein
MSEKFYIVSASELATLIMVSMDAAHSHMPEEEHGLLNEVKAACRAKEVRFIGAADQGNSLMLWGEVKK